MKASAISFFTMALAIVMTTIVVAQEARVPDLELDFRFLRLGLSRKAVINTLGTPNSQTESQTLTIKSHKLTWTDPEGQKFVAAFIQNRLWRWKMCSVNFTDC